MTQLASSTLYSYCNNNITLKDAITNCHGILENAFAKHGRSPIALLYSPNACQLLCLKSGYLYNANDQIIHDLSDVFEARIFTEDNELRWLNRNSGNGKAVLLSESEQSINNFTLLEADTYDVLPQQYLLWGKKATNQPTNWLSLSEARIGKLEVPINHSLKNEERVYLKSCEYIAKADCYGNYMIAEERLVKLEAQ